MNFDVNKMTNPTPKKKRESAVHALQRKNEEYNGIVVDHVEPKKGLKTSTDRDLDDVTRELPNTLNDIVGFGARIEASKRRLGLGEGGFVDCEMEIFNFKTGTYEGREWRTSQQINAEFIIREPMMSDEQLDDFMRTYFVEFNTTTGEVYPKRYPNVKNIKFSVSFPEATPPKMESVPEHIPDVKKEVEPEVSVTESKKDDPEPILQEIIPAKKVILKTEERKVGVRKQLHKKDVAKLSEMVLDRNSVSCVAIASRYKCDITGVTYEEYEQIHTMVETSNLARETKMWSVIYRHVKNVSIGEFKDFNDFCEHTAYADRNRFWFALMCTMTRDVEKVPLICRNLVWKPIDADAGKYDLSKYTEEYNDINDISLLPTKSTDLTSLEIYTVIEIDNEKYRYIPIPLEDNPSFVKWTAIQQMKTCDTTYDHEYFSRSIIDLDSQDKWVSDEAEKIESFTAMNEAIAYHNEGSLISKRNVPLNDAISIDVGFKSVADVLRNDYKYMLSENVYKFIREYGIKLIREERGENYEPTDEDIDDALNMMPSYLIQIPIYGMSFIDKIVVTIDGEEYESDDDEIIMDTLRNCSPSELTLIYNPDDIRNNLAYRYIDSYEPRFSYKDCTCPVCGKVSNVTIDRLDDLVFTLSQKSMTTTFDIAAL